MTDIFGPSFDARTWRLLAFGCRRHPSLSRQMLLLTGISGFSSAGLLVTLGQSYAAVDLRHSSKLILFGTALIAFILLGDLVPPLLQLTSERLVDRLRASVAHEIARNCLTGHRTSGVETAEIASLVKKAQGVHRNDIAIGVLHAFLLAGVAFNGCLLVVICGIEGGWWQGILLAASTVLLSRHLSNRIRRNSTLWVRGTEEQKGFDYHYWLGVEGAVKEIRVFGLKGLLLERYDEYWRILTSMIWSGKRREIALDIIWILVHLAILILCLWSFAHEFAARSVGVASFSTALPAALALAGLQAGYSSVAVQRGYQAVEGLGALGRFLSSDELPECGPDANPGAAACFAQPASIEFRHVWFTYPGATEPVLRDVSFTLCRNQPTALVGGNGAGKSTIISLLMGVHAPDAGQVVVDGIDLATVDAEGIADWQRSVGLVSQNTMRLPMSLRANVTVTEDARPPSPVLVPDQSLLDFVATLPNGWETPLDAGQGAGVGLSSGQWQRIALARALLRKQAGAGVIVLDEPVAAVDVETEANLVASYLKYSQNAVSLVVSHRFSIVRAAAQIIVLDNGRLHELGDHEELLASGGTYSEMFLAQASHFDGSSDDPVR